MTSNKFTPAHYAKLLHSAGFTRETMAAEDGQSTEEVVIAVLHGPTIIPNPWDRSDGITHVILIPEVVIDASDLLYDDENRETFWFEMLDELAKLSDEDTEPQPQATQE